MSDGVFLESRPPDPASRPDGAPSEGLPAYFRAAGSWADRLASAMAACKGAAFERANLDLVHGLVTAERPGLRAVINLGAHALLMVLVEDRYRNAYDRPRVAGAQRGPSERRKEVDRLVHGRRARNVHYAAVAMGGTGCRFYGEYCLVLRPERVRREAVLDRNSWDLASPPLDGVPDRGALVAVLRGRWDRDVAIMAVLKVTPLLPRTNRLLTAGQVGAAVLHDEDFIEVHLDGTFGAADVEEVRTDPSDVVHGIEVATRLTFRRRVSLAEMLWQSRRRKVEDRLRSQRIQVRQVAGNGRSGRWR